MKLYRDDQVTFTTTVLYIDGYEPEADTESFKVHLPVFDGATKYPDEIRQDPLVIEYDLRPADKVVMNLDSSIFFLRLIVSRSVFMPGTTYQVCGDCGPSPMKFDALTVNL